ncbi:hypothetical protein BV25DRAFT_1911679 [Artomyces pyxidatus]|uniref:Uncharacterized protein n=1 Tax=Artomyces pyxidatus TaxID=48021 RepID=A0ACB8TH67_9AGAM|nr:hypothetical protein BV25DRAFT_1911679 [Artomyces pyxidatus]
MQRSQSAPDVGAHPPRFHTTRPTRHPPKRTKTSIDFLAQHQTRGSITPRTEPEDPFSLGSFFPAHLFTRPSQAEEQEWAWLHHAEEEEEQEQDDSSFEAVEEAASRQTLFSHREEAATGSVIQEEDKLGVLSIFDSFSLETETYTPDDRLYSPYAEDEPCNEESLHLAYGARRAGRGPSVKASDAGTPYGALFLPESRDEQADAGRGWGLSAALESIASAL